MLTCYHPEWQPHHLQTNSDKGLDPSQHTHLCACSETVGKRSNDCTMDGDIFILQRAVSEQEATQLKHPNVAVFLNYLRHRWVRASTMRSLAGRSASLSANQGMVDAVCPA